MIEQLHCTRCKGERVYTKEVEFRHINMKNMMLTSREQVLEVTCMDCEYVGTLESETFTVA